MTQAASYEEWPVSGSLSAAVACVWAARFSDAGEPHVARVIPDGCIDLVLPGDALTIAGPDTSSFDLPRQCGARYVGLRFRPGVAPAVLGVPASRLLNARIDAEDVVCQRALPLRDALEAAPGDRQRASVLEAHVRAWVREGKQPDRIVSRALRELRARRADHSLATLARLLGVSDRQLRRRFLDAVGYGPQMLERVLRLQRFIALASRSRELGLAALSVDAGYADQSHLTRECRELTGFTPTGVVGYPVTAG